MRVVPAMDVSVPVTLMQVALGLVALWFVWDLSQVTAEIIIEKVTR